MLLNQNVTSRSPVTETCRSVWRVTAGGLQAVAELLQVDNDVAGNTTTHLYNVTMRRYACMTLTNLTFADAANKALLCSMLPALRALVAQLQSASEELCQVLAPNAACTDNTPLLIRRAAFSSPDLADFNEIYTSSDEQLFKTI